MGLEEKNREEQYWSSFAETAEFPALPESVLAEKGADYLREVLTGPYNSLTKVLFGELLGRKFGFTDEVSAAQCEALKWIRPMIFSNKRMYVRKREMAESFSLFVLQSENPAVGSGMKRELELRKWPADAKSVYGRDPLEKGAVLVLMRRLNASADVYQSVRDDAAFRSLVLFWIATLMAKIRKDENGFGRELGDEFLSAMFADGLENLPAAVYERKKMENAPEKGKDYFPATIEKLVSGLYVLVKDKYGRQAALSDSDRERIEWTIQKLRETYDRLDDEWGNFRIGTLLTMLGREDEAKSLVMPTVLRNQSQFWAWDMLGRLFPEQRKPCLAKALLCEAEPKMIGKVRREASMLGMPVDDASALEEIAEPALDLLLMGNRSEKGVYDSSFEGKSGKIMVRFLLSSGADVRPVSPKAVKLPRGLPYGTPVTVYLDGEDSTKIVAVRLREAALWDAVPEAVMTYYGKSQKGRAMLTFGKANVTCSFDEFPMLRDLKLGDAVRVKYSTRKCDYGLAYDVKNVELTTAVSNALFVFRGEIQLPHGAHAPGFVNGVYIPQSLVFALADQGVTHGAMVTGKAVRLSPKFERDHRGVMRKRDQANAISLEIASGDDMPL